MVYDAAVGRGTVQSYFQILEDTWKSTSNFEVDFLINDEIAIEVKAKESITVRDLKGLQALQDEKKFKKYYLVCLTPQPLHFGNIKVIHYQDFLKNIWSNAIIN